MAAVAVETLPVEPLSPSQPLDENASDGEDGDRSSGIATLNYPQSDIQDLATLEDFETAHLFPWYQKLENISWKDIQTQLPESWMWDVDYHSTSTSSDYPHGCWTCTPLDATTPKSFPLTIAGNPVVLPVEYTWPPLAGVNPPPDPRPSAPIDCTAEVPLEVIRDLFLTFEGSLGFYLLVNGVLQIIVSEEFDTAWAASHLPHKYGGLKVCYIAQNMDPTMSPSTATLASKTETMNSLLGSGSGASSGFFWASSSRLSTGLLAPSLQLNDFIEARTKSSHRKEKFAGRIGAKVVKDGEPYLVMSSHVITEAILAKSHRAALFGRNKDRFEKLDGDWNEHAEIWAGNDKIGTIHKNFDPEAEIYPNGFMADVTLIKPTNPAAVKDIQSPIHDLRWLSREGWNSLRQRSSAVKILGDTENHRTAKTLKTNLPSEVLVVGEGIFLNQNASQKPTKDHDASTWKDLVSRALLYRVYPDFDPPNGYSGIALYADGLREDGTTGPGVVGFQSFVQRSGHVQNFEMEGGALEKRLKLGRVAFYGAFQVPDALRREYAVV
ncbi:hypothetical protein K505DRAFT_235687 [Melanomma pulvis-pyrius CBS 109.77]|uniref:Uncharacterized protein n=1 Tax=Melanomma pulvis-pyrius CBS 109.77 TaxID=1314802 RepID=A0A6A6XMH3_9PLEO|nr:hypothetical protein K505DRAFT_235687 [Melanomma pulvis-pyrius CBS 109.77]